MEKNKLKALLDMKKYFEEMKETCEKMLEHTNKEIEKIKRRKNGER